MTIYSECALTLTYTVQKRRFQKYGIAWFSRLFFILFVWRYFVKRSIKINRRWQKKCFSLSVNMQVDLPSLRYIYFSNHLNICYRLFVFKKFVWDDDKKKARRKENGNFFLLYYRFHFSYFCRHFYNFVFSFFIFFLLYW